MEQITLGVLDLPWGRLTVGHTPRGVCYVSVPGGEEEPEPGWIQRYFGRGGVVRGEPDPVVSRELEAYFLGRGYSFTVPLDLRGTDFQLRVWETARTIPYGSTWSYGEVASALGRPGAARAVGRALGTNPVAIIVPCHRVVGADGSLVGFGGGLDAKRKLLSLERHFAG